VWTPPPPQAPPVFSWDVEEDVNVDAFPVWGWGEEDDYGEEPFNFYLLRVNEILP
jgi:hypothetical protein